MSVCKQCGAPIVWIRTPSGRAMPCDASPVYIVPEAGGPERAVRKSGEVIACRFAGPSEPGAELAHRPHFATCAGRKEEAPTSPYTNGNPYGYRLHLQHPLVYRCYVRYKEARGIGSGVPLSDEERRVFEDTMLPWLEQREEGEKRNA